MDVYWAALKGELREISGLKWQSIAPGSAVGDPRWKRLFQRTVQYPWIVRGRNLPQTVLHVLDHSYAHLCRHHRSAVVTCHDIAEYRETNLNSRQFRGWEARVLGMRQARKIIAVSEATKHDLIEVLKIPEQQIVVSHNGVGSNFKPVADCASAQEKFPELAVPQLKILHIGSNIHRKNVEMVIRALGILNTRRFDFRFVKVGAEFSPEQKNLLAAERVLGKVIHLGRVDTDDLPAIYSLCDVLAFPSLQEGFGLPVLEAQACGLPTILSRTGSLPEVGGRASLYVDPAVPGELADQIQFANQSGEAQKLRELGFENVKRFSWRKHAEAVSAVYAELLSEN